MCTIEKKSTTVAKLHWYHITMLTNRKTVIELTLHIVDVTKVFLKK